MRKNERRGFLKQVAAGTAALGAGVLSMPLQLAAEEFDHTDISEVDKWFDQIKGKHRIVFDVTEPHSIFPFAWPRVFLMTNEKTGSTSKDCTAVVILRHEAIHYAMQSQLWEKYKMGEMFKTEDPKTKAPAVRNPFWEPKEGDFTVPGIGNVPIGINELQASGVLFGVCDMAMTVYSAAAAGQLQQDPATVKKEWVAGLLPGIQPMPSGVWAVGRAQEHGCGYCFVG